MKDIIDAVFIDRDGTIGGDCSVVYPGEFKLYPYKNKTATMSRGSFVILLNLSCKL